MADSTSGGDPQVIAQFMGSWAPLSTLPQGSRLRNAVLRFVAAASQDERAKALESGSALFKLQRIYEALSILRLDRASDPFAELLSLSREQLAASIRQGKPQDALARLQRGFEFGRLQVPPQAEAARTFLLELWALAVRGANMKYCIYPNGIPYSGGGKTHEEMARQYVTEGLGSGQPVCGGVIYRIEPLAFTFDISSTAFRNSLQPEGVRQTVARWIRTTGGDEQKVVLKPQAAGD